MKKLLKRFVSKLPVRFRQELKRLYFARQIKYGEFVTFEKEFSLLEQWLAEGDWVVDIGANVGFYTLRSSQIVGKEGRVIAIEPVPETFELLAANVARDRRENVTLLNIAASDSFEVLGIKIPTFDTGLKNYYEAHLSDNKPDFNVLCLPIDSLNLPQRIKLIKVDAEGHDFCVLRGMRKLLERDHPTLIIESAESEVVSFLSDLGYSCQRIKGFSNLIFQCSQLTEVGSRIGRPGICPDYLTRT